MSKVMRALRTSTSGGARLLLRKLHIRWWHATAAQMTNLLKRAGAPAEVLDMISEIVQTCSACRAWHKPLPESVASVELADQFNNQVEADIWFVYKFMIFHMVDRCTRWHAATVISSKEESCLIEALEENWIQLHGPMKELITDMESGIAKSEILKLT